MPATTARAAAVVATALPVAFVALPAFDFALRMFPAVGRARSADVIGFGELAAGAAPHIALVATRRNRLALCGRSFLRGLRANPAFGHVFASTVENMQH